MRNWTEKDRKRQACIARRNKPWKNATGPKTPAGKYRSARNALKEGYHAPGMKALARLFGISPEMLRDLMEKQTEQKQSQNKGLESGKSFDETN